MKGAYISLLIFLLPAFAQAASNQSTGELYEVCFYEHEAYQGRSLCHIGVHGNSTIEVSDLASGEFNDKISSISIRGNARVSFWKDAEYSGEKHETLMDVYRLIRLNDSVSSYKITEGPIVYREQEGFEGRFVKQPASFACLFQDAGYEGTPVCLTELDFDAGKIPSLTLFHYNDEASSLFIKNRYPSSQIQVDIYQDDHFSGSRYSTNSSIINLRDVGFNDKASSMVVSQE